MYAHFAPASPATGTVQASLTVAGTPGGTVAAALSGDAETPASIAFGQGTYTLGPTAIGMSSSPVTLTIVNSGGVPSGVPGTPSITGPNASDFAVVANNCTAAILPMGTSCSMSVVFTPQTTSGEQATITVAASPGGTAQATLSGTGLTAPALAITPDPGNTFQATVQGQTSAPVLFTLKNNGQTTSGVINAPTFSGGNSGDFAVVSASDGCAGTTLAQNATCTFQVTFTPSTATTESTNLAVSDSLGDGAIDSLTAIGVAAVAQLQINPSSYGFPATLAAKGVATYPFTIKNIGTAATTGLTVQNVTAPFSQANNCPASLGVGGSCSMTVTFAPTVPGPNSDTISIVDTASDTATLNLTGPGVNSTYYLIVSPDPGAFGMVTAGTSKMLPFTVTNYGQTQLPGIAGISFTGNNGPMFSSNFANSSCYNAALTELQSCSLNITFSTPRRQRWNRVGHGCRLPQRDRRSVRVGSVDRILVST